MPLTTAPLFLAEITAYDPRLGTTRVLRYASGSGYTTGPSATPANTFYDARISQPVDISRTMFSGGTTMGRSTVGLGDLVLNNADGLLDDLNDYGFDGQAVTIYRTTTLNPAYPADFTTVLVGTMSTAEFTADEIRIKLRDKQQILADTPFQTTKYAGTNSLPSGLEGVATDLKGKPKPVLCGTVKNIAPPCVNTSKLIYQVNDGAINSIDAVYDRGIPLTVGLTWVSHAPGFGTDNVSAIAYGNGLWVAVGTNGKLATSPDGVTWTLRTSGFGANNIYCVLYANGLWLIGGSSGLLSTSTDAITWTSRTTGFSGGEVVKGIAYGNGLYYAIGIAGEGATSSDGTTWTHYATTGLAQNGVAFASDIRGGVFVVVGDSGYAFYTPDGNTQVSNPNLGTANLQSVAYGRGLFVAVGDSGTVHTSIDGLNWFARPSVFGGANVTGVAYGNGQFIISGATGGGFADGQVAASADAVTWVASAPNFTTANALCVAYGSNQFLVGGVSNRLVTSTAAAVAYSSQADLLDDSLAPAPGTYKVYAAGGYFRLGSRPAGIITCDATQGANAAARTAARIASNIIGRASQSFNATDLTNLDTANSAVCGYWSGLEETNCGAAIDLAAQSVGAWWGVDSAGAFRIKQLTAPSGTAALTITANDLLRPLERIATNDPGQGVPNYKVTVRYGRYYQTLTTDLATGVDDATRAAFAQEWRDATTSDSTVLTAHPLSQPLIIETLMSSASDAATEASRVLTLRSVKRDLYELVVELNSETNALDLGSVIELVHPRFGLSVVGSDSSNALFRVIDIRPNAEAKELTLTVWGKATGSRNRITVNSDGPRYRITSTGAYRVTAN